MPTEVVDLNNKENLFKYEIHSIGEISNPVDLNTIDLKIPESEIPNPAFVIGIGNITGISDNPPVLHKIGRELIIEKIWWVEQD
jgi:hypothetical protein